ncbi:hypothetical protein FUT79_06095 [Treponema phagedenis]|uniref:Uncharacterized protein n=1 Tax=Treponema phagedenis TaxID=162 RepID=A0AAE6M701_TREPH|nr:hypothetical protein FUT79_06095 [Treponema phagedenis]QEJ98008.1 hypothetical protein FUT82_08355 [Treponema phagedenis]QEK03515.1 hypothetical protein FUT83_06650 [Treponema phagedenis]
MAVVPNRIEFENYHSYINRSFQTHRFHFATDGKNQSGHGRPWFQADGLVFDTDGKSSTDLIKNTKNQYVGVIPYSYGKFALPCAVSGSFL